MNNLQKSGTRSSFKKQVIYMLMAALPLTGVVVVSQANAQAKSTLGQHKVIDSTSGIAAAYARTNTRLGRVWKNQE